jgi:hypothetical protein
MADYPALIETSLKAKSVDIPRILEEDCIRHAYAAASRGEWSLRYLVPGAEYVRGLEEAVFARGIPVTSDGVSVTLEWGKV